MLAICGYLLMFCFAGLVMYAYYYDCSPLLTGKVRRADQLLPVFVLEVFSGAYGFAGLFTAAVFSASLSSMAGGINALAAVTILDVIEPIYARRHEQRPIPGRRKTILFKGLVVVYGLITIGFAYLAPYLGAGLLQLAINLIGVVGAPMLAVFFMGMFMPCINALGAIVGLVVSLAFMLWLSFGGIYVTGKYKLHIRSMLPLNKTCSSSAVGQVASNVTTMLYHVTGSLDDVTSSTPPLLTSAEVTNRTVLAARSMVYPSAVEKFYMVSYMWYGLVAVIIALVVGFLVSWISGFRRNRPVDKTLTYMCCYKESQQDQPPLVDDGEQLEEKDKMATLDSSKSNGTGVVQDSRHQEIMKNMELDDDDPFKDVDDSEGVYTYGFIRERCSHCQRSRIIRCSRL
jgi:Na+/proline symporter